MTLFYKFTLALTGSLLISGAPRAADQQSNSEDMVVTASRTPLPAHGVGSSISVITADQIDKRRVQFASDLLRSIPGAAVNRSGSFGAFTQIRLRGAEANQVLVLIDGVEATDPARGEFDFANLSPGAIERIEVLRGEQSALWGADAIGGVINIITKQGERAPVLSASAEYGSLDTKSFNANLNGGGALYSYSLSGNYLDTNGANIARTGAGKDGYDSAAVHFKGTFSPLERVDMGAVIRYVDSSKQFDADTDFNGFLDDANRASDTEEFYARVFGKFSLWEGKWRHEISAALTDVASKNFSDGALANSSDGNKKKIAYETSLFFGAPAMESVQQHVTFIVEAEREEFKTRFFSFFGADQKRNLTNIGIAGEYGINYDDRYFLNFALRRDNNDFFKNVATFSVSGAINFENIGARLHGRIGNGVKNPSFTELFGFFPGSFIGNPDLKPEKSSGWEIGVEKKVMEDAFSLDVTYFDTELEDEVFTAFLPSFMSTPGNRTTRSKRRGVEVSATANPLPSLSLTGSYSYIESKEAGVREIRRPRHAASFNANLSLLEDRANLNLNVDYNGKMQDDLFTFPVMRVNLKSFTLVSLAGSYKVTESVSLFARGENLADENYEEIIGFRAQGIAAFGGIRISFGS